MVGCEVGGGDEMNFTHLPTRPFLVRLMRHLALDGKPQQFSSFWQAIFVLAHLAHTFFFFFP